MTAINIIISPGIQNYETLKQCVEKSDDAINKIFIIKPTYQKNYIKTQFKRLSFISFINLMAGAMLINILRRLLTNNMRAIYSSTNSKKILKDNSGKIKFIKSFDDIIEVISPEEENHFIVHSRDLIPGYFFTDKFMKWKFFGGHPGLINRYRGIHSCFWSKFYKEKTIGWSVFELSEKIDNGKLCAMVEIQDDGRNFLVNNWRCLYGLSHSLGELTVTLSRGKNPKYLDYSAGNYFGYPKLSDILYLTLSTANSSHKIR